VSAVSESPVSSPRHWTLGDRDLGHRRRDAWPCRVRHWARTAPDDVLAQLGIRYRRPSEKTFRAVFSRVDPDDMNRRLGAYFTAHATGWTRPG
jgi:hypothetical protein